MKEISDIKERIKKPKIMNETKIATHNSHFHLDDVYSRGGIVHLT